MYTIFEISMTWEDDDDDEDDDGDDEFEKELT